MVAQFSPPRKNPETFFDPPFPQFLTHFSAYVRPLYTGDEERKGRYLRMWFPRHLHSYGGKYYEKKVEERDCKFHIHQSEELHCHFISEFNFSTPLT
jgi:ATP phosphoribosyltransferase regulatory subunit HisZ